MRKLSLLFIAMLVLLAGCGQHRAERQIYIMDTVVDITVCGESGEAVASQVEDMLSYVDTMCSPTNPQSDINRVNSAGAAGATVPNELCQILDQGKEICARTDGAFDPTLGSLIDLWDIGGENNIPTDQAITNAGNFCGADKLEVGNGYVRVENGTVLNLGGIAKGYAANRAMEIFEENNVESALLSIGGNICAKGTKEDGTPWSIGVRDPKGSAAEYIGILAVEDTVIAVSGDYERYFERDGVRYHHILNPSTGKPAASDILSVSIVTDDGVLADALSTALFVMGKEKALELWRASDDFECIIVDGDMRVTVTDGLSDKFRLTDGRCTLEIADR